MNKIEEFWKWFIENNKPYLFINQIEDIDERERLLNDLNYKLHVYCDQLFFEIGGYPNGIQELIITAEGKIEYFDKVEKLIANAPSLKSWKFIAFIQPKDTNFEVKFEDLILKPDEIWFLPLKNSDTPPLLGLRICLKDFELLQHDDWLEPAVYKMLDTILGEKSFAIDVHHIEINQLPDNPEEKGLMKLSDLQDYVKWYKQQY